jgi:hypothetical protein
MFTKITLVLGVLSIFWAGRVADQFAAAIVNQTVDGIVALAPR